FSQIGGQRRDGLQPVLARGPSQHPPRIFAAELHVVSFSYQLTDLGHRVTITKKFTHRRNQFFIREKFLVDRHLLLNVVARTGETAARSFFTVIFRTVQNWSIIEFRHSPPSQNGTADPILCTDTCVWAGTALKTVHIFE